MSSIFSGTAATPSPLGGLASLLAQQPAPQPGLPPWIAVTQRFTQFDSNLALTPRQQQDGLTKAAGVVGALDRHYYDAADCGNNGFLVGSWGKGTMMRPPRDVDVFFVLPAKVYWRFHGHSGNRQSALLQEVKRVLASTYPNTTMRGDGQVVMVGFGSYSVEVVPAFRTDTGCFLICDTNGGGADKSADPDAEKQQIGDVDGTCNDNLRPLIRMVKAWQQHCSVPIKSFQLELVAVDFLRKSPWRRNTFFYFDWIMRDFFAYLYGRANSLAFVPGTVDSVWLGDNWQSRALSAYGRAVKACDYEYLNKVDQAGEEWQKIFGSFIPRSV